MLHLPSYNMGLAAGITAKDAGIARPSKLEEIPGFDRILDSSERLDLFFPSSYVEGFVTAYDHPCSQFAG